MPDKNPSDSNNTPEVHQITAQGETLNIYHKTIKVNGTSCSAFIDFESQCTIITKSTVDKLNIDIHNDNLPVMKGFAFGAIHPIGYVMIDVNIDFVHSEIQAFVVPDKYLSTDILIGQNLTELSDVIVHKTNRNLVLYSEKLEIGKVKIYASASIELTGIQSVSIYSDAVQTGLICIPGSTSLKANAEYIILQGVYHLKQGLGAIIAINIPGSKVVMGNNKLLARAHLLPVSSDLNPYTPNEFIVNHVQLNNNKELSSKPIITPEMINVGPDATKNQIQRLLDLLNTYRNCFALNTSELGVTNISEMHIKLNDESPVSYKPYRLSYKEREIARRRLSN
ncbi:unnamed protein product [Arctia plantaginis]|uniref:Peptidase A2B Ty3 transposon peptidase domain-containing protein n=1 Tax=Arctia plantaginis TaxID=874455 RepID=A0A8S1BGG1_ARCPL|nr:unnamed protein product [Arctia plantaginis]